VKEALTHIQHDLFDLGGELSIPGHRLLEGARVEFLEAFLDRLNAELQPLEEFILPGGSRPAALTHLARTVCRRAERNTVHLSHSEGVSECALQYLNRLSDLLFVVARHLNRSEGQPDILWNRKRFEDSPITSD
jgi:cob(I)alamin adenosyltransferase